MMIKFRSGQPITTESITSAGASMAQGVIAFHFMKLDPIW
jgi:hypothetical protein